MIYEQNNKSDKMTQFKQGDTVHKLLIDIDRILTSQIDILPDSPIHDRIRSMLAAAKDGITAEEFKYRITIECWGYEGRGKYDEIFERDTLEDAITVANLMDAKDSTAKQVLQKEDWDYLRNGAILNEATKAKIFKYYPDRWVEIQHFRQQDKTEKK